jgi:N-acetylated-alpha-linked acidic dipeptidase
VGTLAPAIVDITRDLTTPSGVSLYDAWRQAGSGGGSITSGARQDDELVVTRIGSGSDHTVFINHVGVPVVDMSFNGPYGVYHSAYDSHHWVSTIGDPGFRYAHLMTQLWGTMALRFANAELLPFDVPAYAGALDGFVARLREIPGASTRLDTAPLAAAVRRLADAGGTLATRMTQALEGPVPPATADAVNGELLAFERTWLHDPGIPGRAWFKHLLYAPRYTYAAMSLPGVTEAAEAGDWVTAQSQLALLVGKADENTARVTRAAALLDRSPGK